MPSEGVRGFHPQGPRHLGRAVQEVSGGQLLRQGGGCQEVMACWGCGPGWFCCRHQGKRCLTLASKCGARRVYLAADYFVEGKDRR